MPALESARRERLARVPKTKKVARETWHPPTANGAGCRREGGPRARLRRTGANRAKRARVGVLEGIVTADSLTSRASWESARAQRVRARLGSREEKPRRGSRGSDKTRTFFVLNLGLDVVDGVGGLHLEGDGLAGDCDVKSQRGWGGSALGRAARNARRTRRSRDSAPDLSDDGKNAVCNKTSDAGIGRVRRGRAFAGRERGRGAREAHVRVFTKICMVACVCFGARGASKSESRGIGSNAKLEESTRSSNEIAKRVWRHELAPNPSLRTLVGKVLSPGDASLISKKAFDVDVRRPMASARHRTPLRAWSHPA